MTNDEPEGIPLLGNDPSDEGENATSLRDVKEPESFSSHFGFPVSPAQQALPNRWRVM
jgi:hypothetical protein